MNRYLWGARSGPLVLSLGNGDVMADKTIRLVKGSDKKLYFPACGLDAENLEFFGGNDVAILYRYECDYDRISWPLRAGDDAKLRSCLFDARECGLLPSGCKSVELPDGQAFAI